MPLGRDFWRLQFCMLVSGMADGCLLMAPIWWLFIEKGALDWSEPTARAAALAQIGLVMGTVPLWRLGSLLVTAPLGDWFPRKQMLSIAFLARALTWNALAIASLKGFDTAGVAFCLVLAAIASGFVDSVSLGIVPQLVPPSEVKRALGWSAGLPKAGFFVSVAMGLIVTGFVGLTGTLILGVVWLGAAGFVSTRVRVDLPRADSVLSLASFLKRGSLWWLGGLSALTNFVAWPMYSIGAALSGAAPESSRAPDSIEGLFTLGAVLGALTIGWLSRFSVRRTAGSSLAVFGAGLLALSWAGAGGSATASALVTGAAFSVLNLMLLTQALFVAPASARVRAAALMGALFAAGGELGTAVLSSGVDVRWFATGVAALSVIASAVVSLRPPGEAFSEAAHDEAVPRERAPLSPALQRAR